jgi:hypothetical protein
MEVSSLQRVLGWHRYPYRPKARRSGFIGPTAMQGISQRGSTQKSLKKI